MVNGRTDPVCKLWRISLPYLWSLNVLGWVGNNGIRWRLHIRLWKRPPSKSFWKASLTRIHCIRLGRQASLILRSCFLKTSSATTWWERKIRAHSGIQPMFQIHQQGSSEHIDRYWLRKYDGVESRGQRIWITESAVCQLVACDVWTCAIMLGLFWKHLALFNPVPSRILPIFPWAWPHFNGNGTRSLCEVSWPR